MIMIYMQTIFMKFESFKLKFLEFHPKFRKIIGKQYIILLRKKEH